MSHLQAELLTLWRSVRVALLVITPLLCCRTADAKDLNIDAVSEIYVSRNGKSVALLSRYQDGAVIHVLRRQADRPQLAATISESSLSRFLDEGKIDTVEWSANGTWLKIEITDGDERTILVLDATRGTESLQEVTAAGRRPASASWATIGDKLYVATTIADDLDAAADDGIYVIAFPGQRGRLLARGIGVTSRLAVTDNMIIAKIQRLDGEALRHLLVAVDLRTGAIHPVVP